MRNVSQLNSLVKELCTYGILCESSLQWIIPSVITEYSNEKAQSKSHMYAP